MKEKIKRILQFFLNPRFLLCFGLGWMITNGWCYLFLIIGAACQIEWMVYVGGAYAALLWVPATPEKFITCAIAIFLLKRLFPNDTKTLGALKNIRRKAAESWKEFREKHKKSNSGGNPL